MTSETATAVRPTIHLIDSEAETLTDLALEVEHQLPQVSALLLTEIGRARLYKASAIPAEVVTMHSTVTYRDEASGVERTVQLVYPVDADITAGRISILTPIGVGLLGLREGASIPWPDRSGRKRKLTITKVQQKLRGEVP